MLDEVDPNLMRASRADPHAQYVKPSSALDHFPIGQRRSARVQTRRHTRSLDGIARNLRGDAAAGRRHRAVNHREIRLLHRSRRKLRGQRLMRGVGAGHQQDAAGEAIQAVDDPGPQVAADAGQRREMVHQPVHQRTLVHPSARMHRHARRLIHRDYGVVRIQDLDRQILGRGL